MGSGNKAEIYLWGWATRLTFGSYGYNVLLKVEIKVLRLTYGLCFSLEFWLGHWNFGLMAGIWAWRPVGREDLIKKNKAK